MTTKRHLTLSEIAELTGFAVPTVSNWIRRFDDFPEGQTFGGSRRPRYDIDEVLAWLERRKLSRDAASEHAALFSIDREHRRDFLGTLFNVLHSIHDRQKASVKQVMEKYEELASSDEDKIVNFDLTQVRDVVSDLVPRYKGLSDAELAGALSAADEGAQSRSWPESTTPEVLVEFLGALAPRTKGTVLDLASGQGKLLEHLATNGIGETHVGREINYNNVVRARQSARLRDLDITYLVANGIASLKQASCSLVVVDPPLGLRLQREEIDYALWPFARPSSQDITTAFIQRAVEALEPGGTALVLSSAQLLQKGGEASELRRQLLISGAIRGIVALPPRLRANTAIPLALWILGPADHKAQDVVMVDASLSAPEDLAEDGPVVAAILAELNKDDKHRNEEFATTVPVRELLTRDVALRPNAWVAKKRDLIEPQEQVAIARSGLQAIANLTDSVSLSSEDLVVGDVEPAMISLDDLQSRRSIKIMRPLMVRGAVDGTGAPILDARVLQAGREKDSTKRLADQNSQGLVIEPGDVVVAAGARSVIAQVWDEEGWVAGSTIQVIRPNPAEIDGYFLATAIQHPRNHAHVDPGALKVQLKIRGFEVPDLSIEQQRDLAELIKVLDDTEKGLQDRLRQLSASKLDILQAVGSGTLRIRQAEPSEND